MSHPRRAPGFTLVELIIVIVLMGVLAGSIVMYLRPAVLHYLAVQRRANVSSQADGAARLITTEVRSAVPNSIRLVNSQCVEFVPTSDGGRFRTAPDTTWDAGAGTDSAWMDLNGPHSAFDVLTPFTTTPKVDDFVVIGNQSADDVYTGASRATITSVGAAPAASVGTARIGFALTQFPLGYEGGRFVIVPKDEEAVTYQCVDVDSSSSGSGNGNGILRRYSNYGFRASPTCPPSGTGMITSTIATKVASCSFSYNPNQGATQQSGYLQVQLGIADKGETATLVFGAHVDNAP